jgi:membrane-associated protease RseP (regulator of RpoE activity)
VTSLTRLPDRRDPAAEEDEPELERRSNPRALIQLIVVVAAVVGIAILVHASDVLLIILAIVAMIMLHELGHFATAKWSGMKVTEYFLGFGPRLWSIRRGETEYGVKAIPAGGYVRIVGMTSEDEVDPGDEQRTYRAASFPRRLAVGVAGSTMHFVIAFALLMVLFLALGTPVTTGADVGGLYSFSSGQTPAQLAGLKAGDVFVSMDGQPANDPDKVESFILAHAGQPITFVVRRGSSLVTVHLTPVDGRHVSQKGSTTPIKPASGPAQGVIGIELEGMGHNQTSGLFSSIGQSGQMVGSLTKQTILGIGEVFSPHGLSTLYHDLANSTSSNSAATESPDRPLSIVGVVQVANQAAQQNLASLLLFLAYVNIFFGLFNMFPMLPLDGGHVAIAVYERIRSRRGKRYFADVRKMMPFAYALLAFIAVFGLSALYLDIVSPVRLGG